MECGRCAAALERPGDYCLVCRSRNADAVVVHVRGERATLTMLDGESVVGETTVTTTAEPDAELRRTARRNFAGRIADEVRRKRPDTVYAAGDREVVRAVRGDCRYELYRVEGDDPVGTVCDRRGDGTLDVVESSPEAKLGGTHTTLIGGRDGRRAVLAVADHPNVKKVVPGPISAGGSSRGGVRAKATRADGNGNLRLLVRDGSSVQEVRVVTTAGDRETGERIRVDADEALREAGFRN